MIMPSAGATQPIGAPPRFRRTAAGMSRMPTRFRAPWKDAFSIASQTDPSATSESPISTQTRPGSPSSRMARAMPSPMGRPCPSDPVATSTHGMPGTGTGCPWTGEPNLRNVSSCASSIAPS